MFLGANMALLEVLLTIAPVLVMVGIVKLLSRVGIGKRALAVTGWMFLACAGLLGVNGILSLTAGIVLREVPMLVLLAIGGLTGVLYLLTAAEVYVLKNIAGGNRWIVGAVKSGLLLLLALLCAFVLFVAFAGLVFGNVVGGEIRTVEYEGQMLVERNTGFLDFYYEYHTCYGALFRGAELLYHGPSPLC